MALFQLINKNLQKQKQALKNLRDLNSKQNLKNQVLQKKQQKKLDAVFDRLSRKLRLAFNSLRNFSRGRDELKNQKIQNLRDKYKNLTGLVNPETEKQFRDEFAKKLKPKSLPEEILSYLKNEGLEKLLGEIQDGGVANLGQLYSKLKANPELSPKQLQELKDLINNREKKDELAGKLRLNNEGGDLGEILRKHRDGETDLLQACRDLPDNAQLRRIVDNPGKFDELLDFVKSDPSGKYDDLKNYISKLSNPGLKDINKFIKRHNSGGELDELLDQLNRRAPDKLARVVAHLQTADPQNPLLESLQRIADPQITDLHEIARKADEFPGVAAILNGRDQKSMRERFQEKVGEEDLGEELQGLVAKLGDKWSLTKLADFVMKNNRDGKFDGLLQILEKRKMTEGLRNWFARRNGDGQFDAVLAKMGERGFGLGKLLELMKNSSEPQKFEPVLLRLKKLSAQPVLREIWKQKRNEKALQPLFAKFPISEPADFHSVVDFVSDKLRRNQRAIERNPNAQTLSNLRAENRNLSSLLRKLDEPRNDLLDMLESHLARNAREFGDLLQTLAEGKNRKRVLAEMLRDIGGRGEEKFRKLRD